MTEMIRPQTTSPHGVALNPDDLRRASAAFQGAWLTVAAAYGRDVGDHTAIECQQLAQIVMQMVKQGPMSPADIATASIDRMRPQRGRPDLTRTHAS